MFGLIGGIGSLVGGLMDAGTKKAAREAMEKAAMEAMALIKSNALQQEHRSFAPRVDPYGNRTVFDPIMNTWVYDLTPMQKRLLQESQVEQERTLTVDAQRARRQREMSALQNFDIFRANQGIIREGEGVGRVNRAVLQQLRNMVTGNQDVFDLNKQVMDLNAKGLGQTGRIFDENLDIMAENRQARGSNERLRQRALARGNVAAEDYNTALMGYRYDTPPSEGAIRDQLMKLIQQSIGQGERAVNTLGQRFLERTAGKLPVIHSGMFGDQGEGQQLANTMMAARREALNETGTREQMRQNKYLPVLERWRATMDMGQTSPTPLGTATNAIAPFMPLNLPTLQSRPGLMGTAPISGGTDATGAAVANLNSTQGAMMGQIMAALQNEATNVNAATQNIIRAHTPGANANDFGGMGGALGGIAKGLGGMMGGGMF